MLERGQLTIGMLQSVEHARWDAFVDACPCATFFHRAGWQTVIERAFGHKTWFMYAEQDGQLRAILPMAQIKSVLFGHTLSCLPFCVYGGIAATDPHAALALDHAAQQLAAKLRVDHLEYRHVTARHPEWPSKTLYVTFRKPLQPDPDQNMLEIPRKQRAMVRKGISAGLHSEIDQDVERFFCAYSASVHNLGTPVFSKKYFQILKQVFGQECELMTICLGRQTVCSVLSFYFRDQVLPYYGGGGSAARALAGNDFMYWELMRRACQRGYKVFDFGRSKIGTGAFDFKKNWGFAPTPLHYEYQLHRASAVPDHNPLNPRYQLLIKAWQKLPLSLANLLGPHIVRNLG